MKVAIVGYGFVGKATEYLLRNSDVEITVHDPHLDPILTIHDWDTFDYAFICVPTPSTSMYGALDPSIAVQEALMLPDTCVPVVRSTVGPDQVYRFPERTIFMPEFLREMSWKEDVDDRDLPLIVGNADTGIFNLLRPTEKTFIAVSNELACMYKIARNTALAMTVAVANHLSEACSFSGVKYSELAGMLQADPVLANSHWDVPGPDGNSGFGGKCLPKDLGHASTLTTNELSSTGIAGNLLATALYINDTQWRQ